MNNRMLLGITGLFAVLLLWNIKSIQNLETRIATLETANLSSSVGASAGAVRARGASADASPRQAATPAMGRKADELSTANEVPDEVDGDGQATLLGLEDPQAREAFEAYLDEYLTAREEDRSYDEETDWLDHLSTTIEVYCEDENLSGEVQEHIMQRLETAHSNWTAADAAVEAGEIDRRELIERHRAIEEAVTSEMTELLGEEGWEDLAGHIW